MRWSILSLLLLSCCATMGTSVQSDRGEHAVGLRLADATLRAGAPDSTLSVADNLLKRDPRDADALTWRGRALLALHRPGEAAQSFAAALAVAPDTPDASRGLARARSDIGDAAGAETAWRDALAHHPSDTGAQAGLAVSLDLQDRHTEAQGVYRTLLAAHPDDAAVRSDLGLSLALSGQGAAALPLLTQAAAGQPGPAGSRMRHNLAVGLALAGDWAAARALLTELDGHDPRFRTRQPASARIPLSTCQRSTARLPA